MSDYELFRSLSEPVQIVIAAGLSLVAITVIVAGAFIFYQMIKRS